MHIEIFEGIRKIIYWTKKASMEAETSYETCTITMASSYPPYYTKVPGHMQEHAMAPRNHAPDLSLPGELGEHRCWLD